MAGVWQWRDAVKMGVGRDGREVELWIKESYTWGFALGQVLSQ